jgi:hypothetical protein
MKTVNVSIKEIISDPNLNLSAKYWINKKETMNEVKMISVKSSQIDSVGYDAITSTLYIEFKKGSVYSYAEVPIEKYNSLLIPTISVGKYFFAEIKGKYTYEKLPVYVKNGQLVQI